MRQLLALLTLAALGGCTVTTTEEEATRPVPTAPAAGVVSEPFAALPDGSEVNLFTLRNTNGVTVRAIDYGGIILSLEVPDRNGELGDVALGYDDLEGYLTETPYFGALIGRYGNRIAGGRFELDGATYELARNDGPNHLHGGMVGYDKVLWEGSALEDEVGVVFRYLSADGEEGYPGNFTIEVTYLLTDDDELVFDYRATTDAPTPVNLTQHTYFNLAGHDGGDVLDHLLQIHADSYTPVDDTLIPTGEIAPVEGTPFDFREPTPIGARIDADHPQLAAGGGYDHNFVLARGDDALFHAVRVREPTSGRVMDVYTTEPGVQFYSGNFLDGSIVGKGDTVYAHRTGFCLETQHFPDSPNRPEFPSTILRPGEELRSRTVYAFATE